MTRAICQVQGRAAPIIAVDRDRLSAFARIAGALDAFGLASRRVHISFENLAYVSNATRESMIATVRDWLQHQGDPPIPMVHVDDSKIVILEDE